MLATDQILNKGRYRIVNTFGQDGNDGMYEAYDTVSNTTVVLKETVGKLGKVTTTSQMEAINLAFLGGAKTLTEIRHESLVSVQDYFADIDRQYLVLEPVTNDDLSKYLEPGQETPDLAEVLSWADQLLDALQYLHTRPTPIVHGDVRPENVKLTANSKVKLLASCPHADGDANLITLAPILPSDGNGINYRPLEQLWDGLDALSQRVILNHYDEESERWLLQPLSAATDLYSLGATLYGALTGAVPPDALDRSIAALEGKADPLVTLAEANPAVPAEISNVIMKAMSLRREDRFYSAVILRQILHANAARVKESEPQTITAAVTTAPPPELPQILSSPDARRVEIEAEQERLEQERIQLEKRRVELEAEMAAQKAEQARVELEAAEAAKEQERLANEQLEKDAAEALERAAKLQAEEETKKAAEQAKKETQPVSQVTEPNEDEDDDDLLEVPETPVAHAHAFASATRITADETVDFVMPDTDYRPSRAKWRVPAMAVAGIMMVAALFGVWRMTSADSTAASTSAAAQPLTIPQQTEVPPPADMQNSTEPTHASVIDTQPAASNPEPVAHEKAPKSAQPTIAEPKKPPTPAPAKTPAPKKAVTVDDLINDH